MVRPFRAPTSRPRPPRPGEISLAHGGVLFLDEMPEMPRVALEALREPLECGRITISRAARQATFPARFLIQVEVPAIKPMDLMAAADGDTSGEIATRVAAARARQLERQGTSNAEMPVLELERHCALDSAGRDLLQRSAQRLGWSGRGLHRVQRLARTVADLAGCADIRTAHIAEAMQFRRAMPQA